LASHVPQATATESETTAPSAVEPQRSRIGEIASEHSGWIGVLVAAVPAVLATAKLAGVAKFDAQNMLILTRTLNVPALLMSILPLVLAMTLAGSYAAFMFSNARRRRSLRALILMGVAYLAVESFLLPAPVWLSLAVATTLVLFTEWRGRKTSAVETKFDRNLFYGQIAISLAATVAIVISDQTIWLPSEVVYTKQGAQTVHVLENTDHDLTVITRDLGSVYTIRHDDVVGRRLCRQVRERPLLVSLLGLGSRAPFTGDC